MKPNNPFLISGYHSPDYFCDREEETSLLIDALHNGRNITLIAPRRMGKTGLIHHTMHNIKLQNPDIVVLYMDIYHTQNLNDFIKLFASAVLGQLDSAPHKALHRVAQFVRSCRPVISFDEFTGIPKVTIDFAPNAAESTLKEIFNYLASSEHRCYIAIDEFQQIAEYPEQGVEALLRSYIQFLPNVNFIFAGSKQHVLQEMFTSSKRPFYQSTQITSIGKIDETKYFNFASRHLSNCNSSITKENFSLIYNRFDGHTWYLQYILNRLYGQSGSIEKKTINSTISQITSELDFTYSDLMKAYPTNCGALLKAIANEGCVKEPLSGSFIAKYHLKAASSVSSSLKKLINNELIYLTPEGYIIYDRFMAIWLKTLPF